MNIHELSETGKVWWGIFEVLGVQPGAATSGKRLSVLDLAKRRSLGRLEQQEKTERRPVASSAQFWPVAFLLGKLVREGGPSQRKSRDQS